MANEFTDLHGKETPVNSATGAADKHVADITAISDSCRVPVMALLVPATGWLVAAAFLSLLASVKLHAPAFLAPYGALTYGRLQPAAWNALVFGFCVPAGLAVTTWIAALSASATLKGGAAVTVASLFWNLGMLIGAVGILLGDSTGIESLELPSYVAPMMFGACVVLTGCPLASFYGLRRAQDSVAGLYSLAALVVLPWFHGTALLCGVFIPLRGVLQVTTQAWFTQGLIVVWGAFTGLAALFHVLTRATGLSVRNPAVASFGFWTLAIFGGLGASQRLSGGPYPAWMIVIGTVASVLTLFPVCAVLVNLAPLLRASCSVPGSGGTVAFASGAVAFYVFAMVAVVIGTFPAVGRVTQFTTFQTSIDMSLVVGFLLTALLGATSEIMPQLANRSWPRGSWMRAHLIGTLTGAALLVAGLCGGGVVLGSAWNDVALPTFQVVRRHLPWAATGSVAWLLILFASLLFATNLGHLLVLWWRQTWRPVVERWFREIPKPGEIDA